MNTNRNHMNIELVSVNHYPAHWHDFLELIAVVKGSVKVKDGFEEHRLYAGDVIVINTDDLHAIYHTDEENLVIIVDIDMKYFAACYPSVQNTIIVCDSNTDKTKYQKQVSEIFLSVLNLYVCSEHKSSPVEAGEIESLGLELLQLLIDNFRYFRVNQDRFTHIEGNDLHAKTLSGAMDYICRNFRDKITLQDISEEVNFNKYYISHMIKDVFGLSFKEYINMLQAENSEKLLLTSRMSITEIAYECGFSDVKYYNKHFSRWYHDTPGDYRRKYKETYLKEGQPKYNSFDSVDALEKIHAFLENAGYGYDVSAKIAPVPISIHDKSQIPSNENLNRFSQFELDFLVPDTLTIYKTLIDSACKELALKTVRLKNMIYAHNRQIQTVLLSTQDGILDLIYNEKLNLIIPISVSGKVLKKNLKTELSDFFARYIIRYGGDVVYSWVIELSAGMENEACEMNVKSIMNMIHSISKRIVIKYAYAEASQSTADQYHIYDTVSIFPYMIKNFIAKDNGAQDFVLKMIDSQKNDQTIFHGDSGLMTCNGFKKASYYLCCLLAMLGEKMIEKSDSYILTKKEASYQLLLFNIPDKQNEPFSEDRRKTESSNLYTATKNFVIHLDAASAHRLIKYTINREHGSVYDIWTLYGSPKFLSGYEEKLISQISFPKVEFEQLNQGQNKIELALKTNTVQLLEITEIH
ncbi:MAG: helix-turn-helix domain-containing protein [Eubacteriales bacterium]|nr:helix-turn-helix domain-containing protein [Eubacteriales bacterium]